MLRRREGASHPALAMTPTPAEAEAGKADHDESGSHKPEPRDAAINKYDFDAYGGKLYRIFEGSVLEAS